MYYCAGLLDVIFFDDGYDQIPARPRQCHGAGDGNGLRPVGRGYINPDHRVVACGNHYAFGKSVDNGRASAQRQNRR